MSDEKYLTAPCGIYCGECFVYKSKDDTKIQDYLISKGIKPESIPCPGCRAVKGVCPGLRGATCETYHCSTNKGIDFCNECPDFPCYNLCPSADKANAIPHNTKIFNLCFIKEKGLEAFVKEAGKIQDHYFKGKMIVGKAPQLK